MDQIVSILETIVNYGNNYIWSFPSGLPWMVVLLLGTGIFLTIKFRFIQFTQFKHAVDILRGKYDNKTDQGDLTSFQALSTAISATVGIGNIAGVATAIHYGGPGAIFWMWITALFGMTTKFTEVTLSHKYRTFDEHGNVAGGPMYYIEKGLGLKWLAVLFACCAVVCSFGSGNMNQANTIAMSAYSEMSIHTWVTGLIVAFIVAVVIIGGIKVIGNVAGILSPFMLLIYLIGGALVLILNATKFPAAIWEIVSNAFNPRASFGGTVAGTFSLTLLWGVKRALFSNEAGQGSAPIAHAAAKTKESSRQGILALLEPFIDTIIICSITGLVIVTTGVWNKSKEDKLPLSKIALLTAPAKAWKAQVPKEECLSFQGEIEIEDGILYGPLAFVNGKDASDGVVVKEDGSPFTGKVIVKDSGYTVVPEAKLMLQGGESISKTKVALADIRFMLPPAKAWKSEMACTLGKSECKSFSGEVTIDKGLWFGVLGFINDGSISNAVIKADENPFSGKITVKNASYNASEHETHLVIYGDMYQNGSPLASWAFQEGLKPLGTNMGNWVVSLSVFLFALSTIISWSYYGDRAIQYLLGGKIVLIYRILYVGFTFLGCILALEVVWAYGDLALGLMALPNLIAILFLSKQVSKFTDDYLSRQKEPQQQAQS